MRNRYAWAYEWEHFFARSQRVEVQCQTWTRSVELACVMSDLCGILSILIVIYSNSADHEFLLTMLVVMEWGIDKLGFSLLVLMVT